MSDAPGVDEVGVLPWQAVRGKRFVRKVAKRIGLNRAWATLIVVLSGLFAVSATITVLVVSLDTIATDLNTDTSTINWALTGPMLAFGVVGPAFGKAGDLWGHKRLFLLGLLGASIFAALTAVAWNATTMILFRTLSATAGSATGPAAMAFINRMFEPEERVRPLGFWSFTTAGAPVLGVVLGAPIVESVGWRVIFVVQAPLLALALLVAWRLLPETDRQANVKFDLRGSAVLGIGATSLLLAINRGHSWGWTSAPVLALLIVGVSGLWVFFRVERSAEAPLLPMRWLRTRNVVFPTLSQSLINFAYMGGFFAVPQLLEKGLDYSTSHIGWLIIARPLTFSIVAAAASIITLRIGERSSGVIGASATIISMFVLSSVGVGSSDVVIVVGLALTGVGLGVAGPAMTGLLSSAVDPEDIGTAAAFQQLMTQLGAVAGTTIMTMVHESTLSRGVVESFGYALWVGAFAAFLGLIAALRVKPLRR
ncbi:MAG: MFS transporter [Acidobacteria bacterium]|nr:MFS transporter [Acidobacteriota bacterium]